MSKKVSVNMRGIIVSARIDEHKKNEPVTKKWIVNRDGNRLNRRDLQ